MLKRICLGFVLSMFMGSLASAKIIAVDIPNSNPGTDLPVVGVLHVGFSLECSNIVNNMAVVRS